MNILEVLQVLVESPVMCFQHREANSKLKILCNNHCYSPEPGIAAQAVQILTEILCYWLVFTIVFRIIFEIFFIICSYKENLETDGTSEVIGALETLILLLTFADDKNPQYLKIALKCAVRLCEVKNDYCTVFVELLGTRLDSIESKFFVSCSIKNNFFQ